ncbi:MAG: hypothetical protein AB7L13_17070 [Acidimicrobiia bacterium]
MKPRVLAAAIAVAVIASCGGDRASDAAASASSTATTPVAFVTASRVDGPSGTTVLKAESAMRATVSVLHCPLA